jgi:dolichol-phosphate mannosyltransferase
MRLLSVVIPTYNEEKTVAEVLNQVFAVRPALKKSLGLDMEVVLVNDGSKDNTAENVKKYQHDNPTLPLRLISKPNGGKGSAFKAGVAAAKGDFIICQDADLEYEPMDYLKVIEPLANNRALVVYGSREMEKRNRWSSMAFYVGGKGVTFSTNILFNSRLTDEPTCYKAFDAELLKAIPIEGNRFEWEPEITAKVLRMRIPIIEVPIKYHPRSTKEGKKIKFKDGIEALQTLLKWRFRRFALRPHSRQLDSKIARFKR